MTAEEMRELCAKLANGRAMFARAAAQRSISASYLAAMMAVATECEDIARAIRALPLNTNNSPASKAGKEPDANKTLLRRITRGSLRTAPLNTDESGQ
jgi:hypothetical protein